MAKKATGKGAKSDSKSSGKSAKSGTAVARVSSSGGRGGSRKSEGFDAGEAVLKLLQSPLVAELIAVAATAALAALAEQGFSSRAEGGSARRSGGKAAKAAGKAAAAAIGRRLSNEFDEIRKASKGGAGA